jgi:cytochrome b561
MIRNDGLQWGAVAKALHWIGAAMILVALGHGWYMIHVLPRADRAVNFAWHAALGYDILALVVLRVLWRWANPVPPLPANIKPWEWWTAHLAHIGLYVLMFGVTVVGWALAGTGRTHYTADLFNLPVPLFYRSDERAAHVFLEHTHRYLAWALAALVVLHIVGALRNHFVKRNDVLRRMTTGLAE